MVHVISMINLKGGVGKTTTTVALAEVFAEKHRKKVLVIDLDPQTNATLALIGEERWAKLNGRENGSEQEQDYTKNLTLYRLFKTALDPKAKPFDIDEIIEKNVSNVKNAQHIDLLPSSIDLIDVQDRLTDIPRGDFFEITPIDLLHNAIKHKLNDDYYDLVLIDCPPNLGIITLNGLRISDHYIIPTIPDLLSTYGVPQIIQRIKKFSTAIHKKIDLLGIIITKYRKQVSVHDDTITRLCHKGYEVLSKIPEGSITTQSPEYAKNHTNVKEKYKETVEKYDEILDKILS